MAHQNPLYGLSIDDLPEGECPADVCPFSVPGAQYPDSCHECVTDRDYTLYDEQAVLAEQAEEYPSLPQAFDLPEGEQY